jgi:pimeloyl-ACP methyl ester carboxylesterase
MPRRSGAGYDWIGFAPRGVKPGKPALSCKWNFRAPNVPFVPANAAQIRAWLRISRLEARGCARNGALLDNMRTTDHARDMDEIRKALGVEQINFYGQSYGSYFGQVYATLFPSRVRRMVLDSNVDPTETWYAADREVTLAAEQVLQAFFDWIARHHGTYRLGRSGRALKQLYLTERRMLRRNPAAGGFGPNEWDVAFSAAGFTQSAWPLLAEAFAVWVRDDNSRPLIRALRLLAIPFSANESAAYLSTVCTDSPWPTSAQRLISDARRLHKRAPIAAWPITWGTAACVYWPAEAGPLFEVPGNGVQMLLLGQTQEAATPFDDSVTVRSLFPESRLVAISGGTTHGSVPFASGPCANARIAAYLKRGVLPPRRAGARADVVCAAPPPPKPVRPVSSARASRFILELSGGVRG